MVAKQHRLGLALLLPVVALGADPSGDWPNYGRTPGGDRHSPLAQINRENVAKLTLAWEYKTGEAGIESRSIGAIEINDAFSLVEVPEALADDVIEALRATKIRGSRVTVRREH